MATLSRDCWPSTARGCEATAAEMPAMLNSLWFGDHLGYLEQLSIQSALRLGHPYTLYSYTPGALRGVPDGVTVRDAREVMSDPRRVRYFEGKFKALGSDFFRYEIFA